MGLNLGIPFRFTAADSILSFIDIGPQQEPWGHEEAKLKLGFTRDFTRRTYTQDSLYYVSGQQFPPLADPPDADALAQYNLDRSYRTYTNRNPEALWTDVFTQPERLGSGPYQNSMRWHVIPRLEDVSYLGDQQFHSGYWGIELPVTTRTRFSLGSRAEGTRITIDPIADVTNRPDTAFTVPVTNALPDGGFYYSLDGVSEEEARASINESEWLPALGITHALTPSMKVRASWTRTIARPTFLELAPVITYDFVTGDTFVGNKDLRISHVENRDLRWEWFPRPGEVVAASLFHKRITDPIEREAFSYLSQDYLLALNYPKGAVRGYELEFRKDLDFLPDLFQFFSVGANYTGIDAEVEVPERIQRNLSQFGVGDVTLDQPTREMEGQPAFLWNVNVTYDIDPWGTTAGLFYSVRGDILKSGAAVGPDGVAPNIFSRELATVNFSLGQKFGDTWKVTFQAKTLLDPLVRDVYRAPDGTEILRRVYRDGVSYSFSVGAAW